MVAGSVPSTGFSGLITGELRSVKDGDSYPGQNGSTVTPTEVRILVEDEVYTIRFPTRDAALAALGGAQERDTVSVPVRPRVAGPKEATARTWIEWRGLRQDTP